MRNSNLARALAGNHDAQGRRAPPCARALALPFSSLALTQDLCVANLLLPDDTPAGYPCKPKAVVTANDFHSTALAQPGLAIGSGKMNS
ncbi:hypothetical protein HU200_065706 [Digitaria exilis]|uniref:Uncharacterized protein n=1 Tax=Digitaria exilis TaxID=1010633 RepID=A0A835DX87_9POAL|nr:hypothetical protein HU200_065706 [Digitaria exilis]